MKIVIDIPEKLFNIAKDGMLNEIQSMFICGRIILGTPLPKGHGRLIDADALEGHRQIQIVPCGNGKCTDITVYYQNDIDIAPTILEADKAESEDKE